MNEAGSGIASLVRTLVTSLVDTPDAVVVTDADGEDGAVFIEITVAEDDVGKVIGRQGRIIKAIRTLTRAAGSQGGIHVDVEVLD